MDNINHHEMVKNALQGKFKGKKAIPAKTIPRYPKSAEREYQRVCRAYMKLLNTALKNHLPELMQAYQRARTDSRFDASDDVEKFRRILRKIAEELEQTAWEFGLDDYVEKMAELANAQTTKEWKRVIKNTFGIDILEDYYKGGVYEQAMKEWVTDNVLKIKSIPTETLEEMESIILNGYKKGESIRMLQKEIQSEYDVQKRKAELLARDQMSTLNAEITKCQQTDAGVTSYKWSTSMDARVRECHAELHGKILRWDDPPEMWYNTKSRGRVYTGRYCNPGEDYMCRCVAIPVFNIETIDLPISG